MREHSVDLAAAMPLMRENLAAGGTVRFSSRGTSMSPMLRNGKDFVELSAPPKKLKKYDLPLYQRDTGEYVMHRIVKTGQTYTCVGDNQFAYETGIRPDQIIAVVTAFTRKGKRYSAKAFSYWLYCRLWHFTRPLRKLRAKLRGRL